MTVNRFRFVATVVLAFSLLTAIMSLVGPFSLDLFAIVAIVVFVTLVQATLTEGFHREWYASIQRLVVVSLVLFTVLIIRRILTIVP